MPDRRTTLVGSSRARLDGHPEEARASPEATRRGSAHAAEHPEEPADMPIEGISGMPADDALVRA